MRRPAVDDIVSAGRERTQSRVPWLAASAVALTILATAGTWRATGWHLPHRQHAAPTPSISVPPLETVAPEPEPLGSLLPGPGAIEAPPYDAGQGVHVVLVSDGKLVDVATVDDHVRQLFALDQSSEMFNTVVPFAGGYAGITTPYETSDESRTTLVVVSGGRELTTSLPGSQGIAPGDGATFWTIDYSGGGIQQRDANGHPIGEPIMLGFADGLVRGLPGGLLLVREESEGANIRVWDPVRERYVRELVPSQVAQTIAGPRHVSWTDPCGCKQYVADVLTGVRREVPLPPGNGEIRDLVVDPTGKNIAYSWAGETGPRDLYVVRPGGKPRLVASAHPQNLQVDDRLIPAWASPTKLVFVQQLADQFVVYAWENGRLHTAGAYATTGIGQVIKAY